MERFLSSKQNSKSKMGNPMDFQIIVNKLKNKWCLQKFLKFTDISWTKYLQTLLYVKISGLRNTSSKWMHVKNILWLL